jgi:hypothetical protein
MNKNLMVFTGISILAVSILGYRYYSGHQGKVQGGVDDVKPLLEELLSASTSNPKDLPHVRVIVEGTKREIVVVHGSGEDLLRMDITLCTEYLAGQKEKIVAIAKRRSIRCRVSKWSDDTEVVLLHTSNDADAANSIVLEILKEAFDYPENGRLELRWKGFRP